MSRYRSNCTGGRILRTHYIIIIIVITFKENYAGPTEEIYTHFVNAVYGTYHCSLFKQAVTAWRRRLYTNTCTEI